jgi:dTDP-4-dehydrorhamnose reductase
VSDLVVALRSFVVDRLPGTWHVTNQGALTWYEFARVVLTAAGQDPGRVEAIKTADLDPPRAAIRPANSELDNRALRLAARPLLPNYRESLDRLVHDLMRP